MAGLRDDLRARAVAALLAANTKAGANVVSNRVDPAKANTLPLISVSASRERKASQGLETGALMFRSVLTLEVRSYAAAADLAEVEDTIETLIQEIQDGLLNSATFLASPVLHVDAVEVDVEFNGKGEESIGFAELRFDCAYLDEYEAA